MILFRGRQSNFSSVSHKMLEPVAIKNSSIQLLPYFMVIRSVFNIVTVTIFTDSSLTSAIIHLVENSGFSSHAL